MRFLAAFRYYLVRVFKAPLFWFIRWTTAPADLSAGLALDPNKAIVYVLATGSISNRLVLEDICKKRGLSRPARNLAGLPSSEQAACLYLPALAGQRDRWLEPSATGKLEALIQAGIDTEGYDMQVVPVSIYWGRNPGKENSLFKLLFSDSRRRPSRLRKFFIILVQGRNCLVNFGQSMSFREFTQGREGAGNIRRDLVENLREHFTRQRTAVLGPSLAERAEVVAQVLNMDSVIAAITEKAAEDGIAVEKARAKARKYGYEIASDYSTATIRFLYQILTRVWNRIFDGVDVQHVARLRELAQDNELVYMPSHRSHLDYLLLSYISYVNGVAPPHIAAGINLNFWPIGGILRRGGAFYLRRSFKGNKLYTAVFRAYVDYLIAKGHSLNFFPEGGRSRTGRLLSPKAGLLAMAVNSALRNPEKPVAIIPTYIGYDKIAEGGSYVKELRGAGKKKESASQLLEARKILRSSYGKSYVSFGNPLFIHEQLDATQPNWREEIKTNSSPSWLPGFVDYLANYNMCRINSATTVNPVGLVAVALLASPQKAIAEDELVAQIDAYLELLKAAPYSPDVTLPDMNGRELVDYAAPIAGLSRAPHAWGDVILVDGKEATLLTYYRNNLLHLFALPSLIANFFNQNDALDDGQIIRSGKRFYSLLRAELFLRWLPEQYEEMIHDYLNALIELGILIRNQETGKLHRPPVNSRQYATWSGLGRILRETLERYSLTTLLLAENLKTDLATGQQQGEVARKEFEQQCQTMTERLAIISGRNAPEFFDGRLFRNYLDTLIRDGMLHVSAEADDNLIIDEQLQGLAKRSLKLLGHDVQQTILQLISSKPVQESRETVVEEATEDAAVNADGTDAKAKDIDDDKAK